MRRLIGVVLTACVLTASADTPEIRVWPMGDSITYGASVPGGYREPLYQMLVQSGYNVRFVGNNTGNPASGMPDAALHHEGYSGWVISQLYNNVPNWLNNIDDPDIVLLHIGTNDSGAGDFANRIDQLDNLIDLIAAKRPYAHIIATTLLTRTDNADRNNNIQTLFNPLVADRVSAHREKGQRVHFLDMDDACNPSDTLSSDGLHPSEQGYRLMASAWFSVIQTIMPPDGDGTVPGIFAATYSAENKTVTFRFSKEVVKSAAETVGNYSIDLVPITSATLAADARTVTLTLGSALSPHETYIVRAKDVPDTDGRSGSSTAILRADVYGYKANVPESEWGAYRLMYAFDIPSPGQIGTKALESIYSENNRSGAPSNFDRVAYYLELQKPDEPVQYVWVSMDAFTDDLDKISVPVFSKQVCFQKGLSNLNVFSNVEGLQTGSGITGNIEFWPDNYQEPNDANVSGADAGAFDFGDRRNASGNYGSMQIHNTGAKQTIFAFNHWNDNSQVCLGIGNNPNGSPDWTFADNGQSYSIRRMRIFVRYPSDTTPPTIASAKAGAAGTQLFVTFSEDISAASLTGASFTSDAFTVRSRRLLADGKTVVLATSPFDVKAGATLAVSGIRDVSNNLIAEGATATVEPYPLPDVIRANVGSLADGYELVLATDVPVYSQYNGDPYAYWFNQTDCTNAFDRIAYYVELQGYSGYPQWVWTSFDAITTDRKMLAVPTAANKVFHMTKLSNTEVRSNSGSVTQGDFATGCNVEFWPCDYNKPQNLILENGSNDYFDMSDTPNNNYFSSGHGSMQIHNYAKGHTIWGMSNFGHDTSYGNGDAISIGIGNCSLANHTDSKDWTFAYNAGNYATRRIYVMVRPAKPVTTDYREEVAAKIGAERIAGFETLYAISNLPSRCTVNDAAWRAQNLYALDKRGQLLATTPRRVAFYMELHKAGQDEPQFIWTAMDPFNDPNGYGMPIEGNALQLPVANLDVFSNVAGVINTNACDTGCIEFWPSNYGKENSANEWGGNGGKYDWNDAGFGTGTGHGSMQVHNWGAGQTLWSIVSFNRGSRPGVGIGNQNPEKNSDPDWTFADNRDTYTLVKLYAFVLPGGVTETSAREHVAAKIGAETLEGYEVLFACDQVPDAVNFNDKAWAKANFYQVDNRSSYAKGGFSRVAYYLETYAEGASQTNYIWTAMDAFTDDPFKVGVPFGGYYFRQTVDHLDVRSNVAGVTSGDDFSNGCIEFWASNYAAGQYDTAWGGSGSTFDWNDSGFGTGTGGYGSMQVHRYGSEAEGEILWCFNEFNKSQKASWGIGRNPNPTAQQDFDWTFTKGNYTVSKFYAFVIPAASDPAVAPDNRVTRTIASTSGDKIAVRFAYEADAAAVAAATFTLDGGVTVTDAKKSDDPLWVVLKTSPLTAGQGYTLTIDGLTRPDGSIQGPFTATVTALTAEQAGLPAGVVSIPEIADGSYKLVQRLDIPLSSATVYKDTLYTVDEEYFGAIPFDRIAYCLDLTKTDGTRTWVYVSMDAFTHDVSKIGVPTYERGVEYQQKVANMNVYASEGANVTTGTGIETGNIEFWPQNYSEGNSLPGLGGRGDKYDYDDTRNGFGYGFGSMQVHNYGAGETIFAYNQFGPANAVPQLGIGNDPNMGTGSIGSDWTHDTNGESFSSRVLYILVRDAGAISTGDGPEIIFQPQDVVCKRRETVVLSVRSGGAVGYQWYHNGVAMEGETSDTLTIASADKADGGTYTVAAISAKGVTMSAPARVTVILDGTILILR